MARLCFVLQCLLCEISLASVCLPLASVFESVSQCSLGPVLFWQSLVLCALFEFYFPCLVIPDLYLLFLTCFFSPSYPVFIYYLCCLLFVLCVMLCVPGFPLNSQLVNSWFLALHYFVFFFLLWVPAIKLSVHSLSSEFCVWILILPATAVSWHHMWNNQIHILWQNCTRLVIVIGISCFLLRITELCNMNCFLEMSRNSIFDAV